MQNAKNKVQNWGFTLVELLIVIALLAAIALIVLSAINPVEQSNRAHDTRFAADSGQLISALERYYASRNQYPWVYSTGTPPAGAQTTTSAEAAYPYISAHNPGIGACGNTACTVDGLLITSNELKQEFRNRDFFRDGAAGSTDPYKYILIGKAAGNVASVYACYLPMSNASRQKACAEGDVYTVTIGGTTRTAVAPTTCAAAAVGTWNTAWYVCLPQ
ncbi:prepilin-type N-terminal cleavage/methylation domain-containing protein [Candidatus Woesebacteria bacterium]|nr:prepilin-type N-terminal cleavage/methylation domain-containing protein [Candidatus Woesebacteria bacterium]